MVTKPGHGGYITMTTTTTTQNYQPIEQTPVQVKVTDLRIGDLVDLASCPFLKDHPTAGELYAEVGMAQYETPYTFLVGFESVDWVGYPLDTILTVVERGKEF